MLTTLILVAMNSISSPQAPLPPPVQVLSQFQAKPDQVRRNAVETYSEGCRDRRVRMRYRKQAGALSRFEQVALDPNAAVRLAAVSMATCFGPAKSAPALSRLIADPDQAVSLKAMNQVADFSDASTTAAMVQWLAANEAGCLQPSPDNTEHCIFAIYATGQSARYEPKGSKLRRAASEQLKAFLDAKAPKAREVTVVALSFVGGKADVEAIQALITRERDGAFTQGNSAELVSQFQSVVSALSQNQD